MNLELNINVQFGVTPQLATFLTALLQSRPAIPAQLPAAEPQPAEEKPRRTRRTKAEAETTEAAPEVPETNAPSVAEEAPQAEPQQEYRPVVDGPAIQPEKELTEEDIRAAMHRTRQRFEGENYKENTDSEAYKKHHKALTAQFKQIAAVLGADKPSTLPADKRAAFIAECDALILDENGLVAPPPAPF